MRALPRTFTAVVDTPPQHAAPHGWFPDPSGVHQLRWYDGTQWTALVSNNGVVHSERGPEPPPRVPHVRLWTFAILSFFFVFVGLGNTRLAFPVGVVFTILVWTQTAPLLAAHKLAPLGNSTELRAMRIVAAIGAAISVLNTVLYMR
jgi:hypothetical protein